MQPSPPHQCTRCDHTSEVGGVGMPGAEGQEDGTTIDFSGLDDVAASGTPGVQWDVQVRFHRSLHSVVT